jgi:O-methyltransferase
MGPLSLVSQATVDAMVEMARGTPPGCFVEVGVYQGGTATILHQLAAEQHRILYLYDTFTGIPWKSLVDEHEIGDFSDTSIEQVRLHCPQAMIVAGVFPASAIEMEPIAFAHLDCDQYRSYQESIEYLTPRMAPGGIMWFDDSTHLYGARLAVMDAMGDRIKSYKGKHYVEF